MSVPRWDGLTGLFSDGGTKYAASRGRAGSATSMIRSPSVYQDARISFPTSSGLWIV